MRQALLGRAIFLTVLLLGIGAAFLAVNLLVFVTNIAEESESQTATAREMTPEQGNDAAPMDEHDMASDSDHEIVVTVRTENLKFTPDTIKVKVGETIRVVLDNHDAFLHDYTTDEAEFVVLSTGGAAHTEHESVMPETGHDTGAQVSLQPLHVAAEGNQHADLIFEATEPGEYEFYCSVPGHREAGMVGKIVIED